MMQRSWVEVDLDTLINNLHIYKSTMENECKVMAVVKANAYGHGDIEVSKELSKQGVSDFAVSNLDEACKLRKAGIAGQILVLGYTPIEDINKLLKNDITQTIISEDYGKALIETKQLVKCQIAIDTGMNRIGINADLPDKCCDFVRTCHDYLEVTGVFTHLCDADVDTKESKEFTSLQIRKFEKVINGLKDLNLSNIHYLNSAGGLWLDSDNSSCVRLGIILYGLKPDYYSVLPTGIRPVLSWKSVVSMVKKVDAGGTIGYGRTYMLNDERIIATIPTGYADGLNRLLSNKGKVLINGKEAPIVGRICMDQFMVDVTDIPGVEMGTEVVLLGNSCGETYTADDMAFDIGTIGYEVVCSISNRVERRYLSRII